MMNGVLQVIQGGQQDQVDQKDQQYPKGEEILSIFYGLLKL